jgi:hypothetical protein
MEAYVSFGTPGVVVAFLIIGALATLIDTAAGRHLRAGNWRGFLLWYLPGLSLLQVIGSFVEITSTAGAALIVAYLVARFVGRARAPSPSAPRLRTGVGVSQGAYTWSRHRA